MALTERKVLLSGHFHRRREQAHIFVVGRSSQTIQLASESWPFFQVVLDYCVAPCNSAGMTGPEFKNNAKSLFGQRGWRKPIAEALQVSEETIWRWTKRDHVPRAVEVAVQSWLDQGSEDNSASLQ